MTRSGDQGRGRARNAGICRVVLAAVLSLLIGVERPRAETQSVIDPYDVAEPPKPPALTAKKPPQPDATLRRERLRAEEEQGKRAKAEARALAAENETAKLRAMEQARQADAAAKAAATKAAARKAAATRAAVAKMTKARIAAEKEAAEKEAAMKEAAARETAAREAVAREAAAREAAARETAAREVVAREAAARETVAREAEAREAAAKLAVVREAAAREARLSRARPRFGTVFRDCADCPEIVWLRQGELIMGESSAASGPRNAVRISEMLAIGRFKVTFAEWDACVAAAGCRRRPDDSGWGRGRQPVININWADAQQYAAWLSRRTSKHYRLLTGTEWEYAARAGLDMYDMHGNVPEWIADCYQYRDTRSDAKAWMLDCTTRMVRGGAWHGPPNTTRSVPRPFAPYSDYDNRIGFRIARTE